MGHPILKETYNCCLTSQLLKLGLTFDKLGIRNDEVAAQFLGEKAPPLLCVKC